MHEDAARKKWTINFALAQNLHARVLPPIEVGCRHGVIAMPPLMTTCGSLAAHRDRVDCKNCFAQRRECARSRAERYHLLALAVAFVVQL